MKKGNLIWMIPLLLFIGIALGIIGTTAIFDDWFENYPTAYCIYHLDRSLNVDGNKLPFTKQSQREAIQWRCAKETIDFNITDFEDIFIFEGNK